jgi:hypothetical protein
MHTLINQIEQCLITYMYFNPANRKSYQHNSKKTIIRFIVSNETGALLLTRQTESEMPSKFVTKVHIKPRHTGIKHFLNKMYN